MKSFSAASVKPCPAQLKLGLRLYTNHLRTEPLSTPTIAVGGGRAQNALAGVLLADLAREVARLRKVGELGLEPDHVRVRRERELALDRSLYSARVVVVALTSLRDCGGRAGGQLYGFEPLDGDCVRSQSQ